MTRERKGKETVSDVFILRSDQDFPPGLWASLFSGTRPLEIDWGCGKGRFLMARAAACPEHDFLGVDLQLRRLGKLNQRAQHRGLSNIRLVCADIRPIAERLVPDNAADICYIFFPDPWPKRKHHPRRLVNPSFLSVLYRILKPGALLHLATDHADYFASMRKAAAADDRFEPAEPFLPTPEERTDFELIFDAQSAPVNRLSLRKK